MQCFKPRAAAIVENSASWLLYDFDSTHPRDCDTLDQSDTSTQVEVAGDRDKAKISTPNNLNKAQIGNFREVLHLITIHSFN